MGSKSESSPRLRILMLHGYTQNGPLFHGKTKALEKHVLKAFPDSVLSYPTGSLRLDPRDVPGFNPSDFSGDDSASELYGWWRRSNTADPPEYVGMEDGLAKVADILKTEGPFDGVVGFSQGACLAALVASLLEGESRKTSFANSQSKSSVAIPYPASFASLKHPPLKFWVSYCGFVAPGERYEAFYNSPHIQTPSCHFIGSLDSLVDETRTQLLVSACGGPSKATVVIHPGGHFVPNQRQYLDSLVGFIKAQYSTSKVSDKREEDEDGFP